MKIIVTRFVLALLVLAAAWAGAAPPAVTTIFLVRHAENGLTPGITDLPLTAAGQARAQALVCGREGPIR